MSNADRDTNRVAIQSGTALNEGVTMWPGHLTWDTRRATTICDGVSSRLPWRPEESIRLSGRDMGPNL